MKRAERGFTLVETMVALLLAGIVAWTAHTTAAVAADLGSRAEDRLSATRRGAAVRTQIQAWLLAARLDADAGDVFSASDAVANGKPDDHLAFTTLAPSPFSAVPTRLSLFIDRDMETVDVGLVATLQAEGAPAASVELARGATGLQARYLFRVGEGTTWFPGWNSTVSLPTAIQLRITGDDLPDLLRLPITVPLDWSR